MILNKYELKLEKVKGTRIPDIKIRTPKDCVDFIDKFVDLKTKAEEEVYVLSLNNKNFINGVFLISMGNVCSTVLCPSSVYKRALLVNANNIIIAHNHPSGDPEASKNDIDVSRRLSEAGNILNVKLLDSLIIGHGGKDYISLKEKGII